MIPDEYFRGIFLNNSVESGEPWYNMCISKDGRLSVIDTRLNIQITFNLIENDEHYGPTN